jgi:hypothetical protein
LPDDLGTGCVGEPTELVEVLVDLRGIGGSLTGGTDEEGTLDGQLNLDELTDFPASSLPEI